MKRFFKFLPAALLGVALATVSPVTAEEAAVAGPQSVAELVTQVESTYKDVQSLQANFEQVTLSSAGEIKQSGTVELMRPRKMRWDTTSTNGALFVTDGEKMWIYTPADKQVMVYSDLSQAGGMGQLDLLENLDSLDESFEIEADLAATGDIIPVTLKPKVESQYQSLKLELSRSDYALRKLEMTDIFGVVTVMTFSDVKLNAELSADRFVFTPPEGTTTVQADQL